MKYIMTHIFVIILIPLTVCASLDEIRILGNWVITKDVTPEGYITGPPEEGARMLHARLSFTKNAMYFNNHKYENISYVVNTYSEDEFFRGWYLSFDQLGISKKNVTVIEVRPKTGKDYIKISQFLVKNNDVLIAITGSGLFEMRRVKAAK
jgi:hypothetical protein